ncbi:MAG: transposase [Clostridiales Family XIII bacterium]|jgi:hypothetical protein|nr:transposase [Clostridiales Family XIII bacterium]
MLEKNTNLRGQVQLACLDSLVPEDHLLRKIDKAVDFDRVYDMVSHLYCEDNGRPSVDPVVLVKLVLLQHIYGIKSLRQTIERVFADAKEKHGMRYTMLRGIGRVDIWITMKFAAMNLQKLALWAW